MRRVVLALSLLWSAACSDSPETEPPRTPEPVAAALPQFVSGQRLHARRYAADGAEAFVSFFDTQLELECAFRTGASWHGLRCVPTAEHSVDVWYLDRGCAQPVAAYAAGAAPGPETGSWVSDDTGEHLYNVGEHVSDPALHSDTARVLYTLEAGECRLQAHTCGLLDCGLTRLTPRTDLELVTAELKQVAVGSDFLIERIVAQDGAALTLGARSSDGVACSFAGDGQCIPGRLATNGKNLFTDADCSDQALSPDDPVDPLDPVQAAEVRYTFRMDGTSARVFALELRSPAYYFEHGFDNSLQPQGACKPLPSDYPAYVAGAEVHSRFARAQPVTTGTGQLHVHHFALDATAAALATGQFTSLSAPAGLVDEHGFACRVIADEAGSLRCFPELLDLHEQQYWADPQCEQRLFTPRRDAPSDAPYMFASNETQGRWTFYAAIRHDDPIYQVAQTQCERATSASVPLYRCGAKLAPTTLPQVTLE